jgi:XTP/dITP diphosphohydrolase
MKQLLLASNNRDKIIEIQDLLKDTEIQIVTPEQLGLALDVVEITDTYAENAGRKACAFGMAAGLVSLADDSGLEVDALGGHPGVRSHRFAPMIGASDADRRVYLLECLKGYRRPWLAHFHCTIAIYIPSKELFFAEGDCYGEIIPEERGENGFGYDPIFLVPQFGLTMAELSLEQKNQISHRARAIQAARSILSNQV